MKVTLELRSTAFEEGGMIPAKHTCDGADISPPLTWTGAPEGTESLVLIVEDIDSVKGIWSHWVVYELPPQANRLEEGIHPSKSLAEGGLQGRNDFDNIGYGGPCPSDGKAHRYAVRLHVLSKRLGLGPGATREQVLDSMEGAVIEQVSLVSRYMRLADR